MGKYKFKGGLEVICPMCGCVGRWLGPRRLVCSHLVEVSLERYRLVEVDDSLYLVAPHVNIDLALKDMPFLDGGPIFRTTSIIKLRAKPHYPWRTSALPFDSQGLDIA